MKPVTTILDACADTELFGRWLTGDTWQAWTAFLAALFGLPMTAEQLEVYRQCTGRQCAPTSPVSEAWLVCGRRSGKSFMLALCAAFIACFRDYREHLGPGERATVMVIATDRRQARVIFRFIKGLLTGTPLLAAKIIRQTFDCVDLDNGISIEVATASYKSTRGYSIVACLCDEIAFWPSDSAAEPDFEVLDALRPAMATIPDSMLLCASSPYARKGALWSAHQRHFGRDGDEVLVWQAATRTMNASVPQATIDRAMERDVASARAEYMAEFRTDVEGFVSLEVVQACVESGVHERPPDPGHIYSAFSDPSGGSSDGMTLCIAHKEDDNVVVVDALREVIPPFSPDAVVSEFAATLKSYRVHQVTGDRYGGLWPTDRFAAHGIRYEPAALPKSQLYLELLPRLNARRVRLLDHRKLALQLTALERRHGTARDVIDHPPNGHDDVVNSVAGVCVVATAFRPVATQGRMRGMW